LLLLLLQQQQQQQQLLLLSRTTSRFFIALVSYCQITAANFAYLSSLLQIVQQRCTSFPCFFSSSPTTSTVSEE